MSKRSVDLDTYSLSLLAAKEDILNPRSSTNWAIFTYEGYTNKLKLTDSGAGGVTELAAKFHVSKPQYGLCKLCSAETGGALRIAMIIWVGHNVDDNRRTECASHIPAIKHFFKDSHMFISADKVEDVTEERIRAELNKAQANSSSQWARRSSRSTTGREELVGTNYRKTNAAMEMRLINRESFWARAEREEEERKDEERKRTLEERRRIEKERVLKERRDAEERDRKMNEKLQMIEEQRRKQAAQEEELRRKERFKWELQQREHEEDMRARLRRSESIEKAAEAAALVSQRSMNPREFFRQLSSSSSSQSPTSPGSRTGKPLRRYQRSLTDTAFIFSRAEESAPSSPRSSPLVSPFSRAPPSPFRRAASPPVSLDFRSARSPQSPRGAASPPESPPRPAPPLSALPDVPRTVEQVPAQRPKPAEPSAPPASPSLLASLTSDLVQNHPPKSNPEVLPASPPNTPTQPDESPFSFEATLDPLAAAAPPTDRLQPNTDISAASLVNAELVSDIGYKVQAVLVEEDEEEEEQVEVQEPNGEEEEKKTVDQEVEETVDQVKEKTEDRDEEKTVEKVEENTVEEVEEKEEKSVDQVDEEEEKTVEEADKEKKEEEVKTVEEEEEEAEEREEETVNRAEEEEKPEEEIKEEDEEEKTVEQVQGEVEEEEPLQGVAEDPEWKQEVQSVPVEQSVQVLFHQDENDQTEDSSELTESVNPDLDQVCQIIKDQTIRTNGMMNRGDAKRENGTERSLSPSDAELSSPEVAVCYAVNEDGEDSGEEISENGEEVAPEQQMCVRALYDYQAEDESEISFEPGDIIRDVEAVDKAWWRGWSKDGRQGLFPANYVETI